MPTVRELTVSALEAMNYRVLAAENGRVALEVLRQADTVDLALIDLVMPVMNGRQLATRIRAADPGRAILFMTGYDDLSGTDDPFAQEMVIKKPFKLVELAAAVGAGSERRSRCEAIPGVEMSPLFANRSGASNARLVAGRLNSRSLMGCARRKPAGGTGPSKAVLALLRGAVYDGMLEACPEFCARVLGGRTHYERRFAYQPG